MTSNRRSPLAWRRWIVGGGMLSVGLLAGLGIWIWSSRSTGGTSGSPVDRPATTPARAVTGCAGAPDTPGGSDRWGGCWPGEYNTGYPHGLPGDTRAPVTLTRYTGPCDIRQDNVVIDSKLINCLGMLVYGKNLTIRNSKVNGLVNTNSPTASMTVIDTEVDGGSSPSQALGLTNVTVVRVNVYNNQHSVHCYGHCRVQDSYLHDQHAAGKALGWHQNGFLTNGGTDMTVAHSTVGCRGGCTTPLTLIPDDNISRVAFDRNLVLASTDAGYCIDVSSNHPSKPGNLDHIAVTRNVFQRGRNGKCGLYGVVGGWDGARNGNVWKDNTLDNGRLLAP